MTTVFVPYEQALALKELGFDEPCIAFYSSKKELYPVMQQPAKGPYFNNGNFIETIRAPLYQQAFRWFREKYNLHQVILADEKGKYDIIVGKRISGSCLGQYSTHEEAELECLKKLIEIVKNK